MKTITILWDMVGSLRCVCGSRSMSRCTTHPHGGHDGDACTPRTHHDLDHRFPADDLILLRQIYSWSRNVWSTLYTSCGRMGTLHNLHGLNTSFLGWTCTMQILAQPSHKVLTDDLQVSRSWSVGQHIICAGVDTVPVNAVNAARLMRSCFSRGFGR